MKDFWHVFLELGQHWDIANDLIDTIEEHVCRLFSTKMEGVNIVRFEMFQMKYTWENKF
jgi:hypothetical protein